METHENRRTRMRGRGEAVTASFRRDLVKLKRESLLLIRCRCSQHESQGSIWD